MSATSYTFWSAIVTFLVPVIASAIPPPKVIEQMNLKADVIAVGEVTSVHTGASTPHFVLRADHVIKGIGDIKLGDHLQVDFKAVSKAHGTPEIAAQTQGMLPVKVEAGAIVVVYVKPSPDKRDHFSPILEGLSVITVGAHRSPKN
jgi:hypothetical protein